MCTSSKILPERRFACRSGSEHGAYITRIIVGYDLAGPFGPKEDSDS